MSSKFTWYGVLLKRGTLDRAENGIKVSYVLNYIDVHSFQSSSKRLIAQSIKFR